jgi:RimJ/RimL family protein N-acetyltransferase
MLRLAPLTADDIPEVMRLERLPFCAGFVGSFGHEKHAAEMASPDSFYLGFREGGAAAGSALVGFVLLQDFRAPVIRLRRIVAAAPGQGTGAALLRAVMAWVFDTTPATGVRLHVRADNARARRIYLREGFGDTSLDDTGYRMSVSREAWQALRQAEKA